MKILWIRDVCRWICNKVVMRFNALVPTPNMTARRDWAGKLRRPDKDLRQISLILSSPVELKQQYSATDRRLDDLDPRFVHNACVWTQSTFNVSRNKGQPPPPAKILDMADVAAGGVNNLLRIRTTNAPAVDGSLEAPRQIWPTGECSLKSHAWHSKGKTWRLWCAAGTAIKTAVVSAEISFG
jgi:hypothetical protein